MKHWEKIIIIVLVFFILASWAYFYFYSKPAEENNVSQLLNVNLKDFSNSPTVSGNFLDMDESNLILVIETYSSSQEDIISLPVQITEETVFTKISEVSGEPSVVGNYADALSDLSPDIYLTAYLKDESGKTMEALMVEMSSGFGSPFEPANF